MKTTLPDGTIFRYRYNGEYAFGEVCNNGTTYSYAFPEKGSVVHTCVWKGDTLYSRGTVKLRNSARKPSVPPRTPECEAERVLEGQGFTDAQIVMLADMGCNVPECPKHGVDAFMKEAKAAFQNLGNVFDQLMKGKP